MTWTNGVFAKWDLDILDNKLYLSYHSDLHWRATCMPPLGQFASVQVEKNSTCHEAISLEYSRAAGQPVRVSHVIAGLSRVDRAINILPETSLQPLGERPVSLTAGCRDATTWSRDLYHLHYHIINVITAIWHTVLGFVESLSLKIFRHQLKNRCLRNIDETYLQMKAAWQMHNNHHICKWVWPSTKRKQGFRS